jgi:hypothetical protein
MIDLHQTLSEWQFLLLEDIKKEYETGLLALNSLPANTVTFYGGSRIEQDSKTYNLTKNIAKEFAKKGWGVVSGGGPGIMEAAIVGAQEGKNGKSVAFRINLANEAPPTQADIDVLFEHFSVRKYMLRQSDVFIYAPGGIGTLDELMENLTLMSTSKYPIKPLFLLDSQFWQGYVTWIEQMLYEERKVISSNLLNCYTIVDTVEEVEQALFGV